MRTFSVVALACLCAGGAQAQDPPLTAAERAFLAGHLERTLGVFDAAVKGVTEAQAKFKETPERWSILEVAEHIAATEDFLFGYATGAILKSPAKPALAARTPAQIQAGDEGMLVAVVDRSKKAQAPEPAKPAGRYATLAAATGAFHEKRAKVMEYVKTTHDGLRSHGAAGPTGQVSDAYQYLLMIAAHTERHVLQMNQVKADASYPAR